MIMEAGWGAIPRVLPAKFYLRAESRTVLAPKPYTLPGR